MNVYTINGHHKCFRENSTNKGIKKSAMLKKFLLQCQVLLFLSCYSADLRKSGCEFAFDTDLIT